MSSPKTTHGKEQGIPPDVHFAFENLLADPQQEQAGGARFHEED